MAEYIEREALMAYPIRINHYDREHGKLDFVLGIESVMEYAENLPAADVVEVVRCKDCKYSRELKRNDPFENSFVDGCIWCIKHSRVSFINGFCSYGRRKDGASDDR